MLALMTRNEMSSKTSATAEASRAVFRWSLSGGIIRHYNQFFVYENTTCPQIKRNDKFTRRQIHLAPRRAVFGTGKRRNANRKLCDERRLRLDAFLPGTARRANRARKLDRFNRRRRQNRLSKV